ncbi:hypothetical protein [Petrachloros mirabilis]
MVEASLAISGLFTAFVVSYWTMKAYEPKEAVIPVTVDQPRYKKAA